MSGEDDKPPIEYRNYVDDHPERRANVKAFFSGAVPGVLITAACGCANFEVHIARGRSTGPSFALVPIFGCVAVIAAVMGITVLRRQRRQFFLGGLLLGVALTCMVEGLCFFI